MKKQTIFKDVCFTLKSEHVTTLHAYRNQIVCLYSFSRKQLKNKTNKQNNNNKKRIVIT